MNAYARKHLLKDKHSCADRLFSVACSSCSDLDPAKEMTRTAMRATNTAHSDDAGNTGIRGLQETSDTQSHEDTNPGQDRVRALGDLAVARKTSLTPASHLTINMWKQLGEHISVIHNCSAWWIGDWLIFGEDRYPDRYKDALAGTSLDYQTLKNYAWVARKFKISRRRDRLSFQHHVEVAALSEEKQDEWLDRAERFQWSRNKLRASLRASNAASQLQAADGKDATVSFKLVMRSTQQAAWLEAAKKAKQSISDWMIAVLDDAASFPENGRHELPEESNPELS